jgi:hypothetical protein
VLALRKVIVMLYSLCIMLGVCCVFSLLSLKCSKCIYYDVAYNRNVFIKGFNKIKLEKKKLELAC